MLSLNLHEPMRGHQDVLKAEAFAIDPDGRFYRVLGQSRRVVGRLDERGDFRLSDKPLEKFGVPQLYVRPSAGEEETLEAVLGGDSLDKTDVLSFERAQNGHLRVFDGDDEHRAYVNQDRLWEAVSGWHVPGPWLVVYQSGSPLWLPSLRPTVRSRPSSLADAHCDERALVVG